MGTSPRVEPSSRRSFCKTWASHCPRNIEPVGEPAAGPRPDPHAWTRQVFLRLLGAVYCVAFLSLWVQIEGLVGSRGILPVRELLLLGREGLGASR